MKNIVFAFVCLTASSALANPCNQGLTGGPSALNLSVSQIVNEDKVLLAMDLISQFLNLKPETQRDSMRVNHTETGYTPSLHTARMVNYTYSFDDSIEDKTKALYSGDLFLGISIDGVVDRNPGLVGQMMGLSGRKQFAGFLLGRRSKVLDLKIVHVHQPFQVILVVTVEEVIDGEKNLMTLKLAQGRQGPMTMEIENEQHSNSSGRNYIGVGNYEVKMPNIIKSRTERIRLAEPKYVTVLSERSEYRGLVIEQ